MATGWQEIDGSWYYLGISGVPYTGWQTIDGNLYYCTPPTDKLPLNGSR